jgi:predicted PhzF superfamily epimerase YddE/YHI9
MFVKLLHVNACTDGLFSGGRAAVIFLRHLGQEIFLGSLADELGFPITAYVISQQDEFITRCFAPQKGEINAHNFAALAVAHAIYNLGLAPAHQPITLHDRGGSLRLFKDASRPGGSIGLYLSPAATYAAPQENLSERIHEALGVAPADVLMAEYLEAHHLLVACRDFSAMDRLDFSRLAGAFPKTAISFSAPLETLPAPGFAVRAFSAASVVEEAPMSLSRYAALGSFWAAYFKTSQLEIHHLSSRNSRLYFQAGPDAELILSGQASTVFRADPVLTELRGEAI